VKEEEDIMKKRARKSLFKASIASANPPIALSNIKSDYNPKAEPRLLHNHT